MWYTLLYTYRTMGRIIMRSTLRLMPPKKPDTSTTFRVVCWGGGMKFNTKPCPSPRHSPSFEYMTAIGVTVPTTVDRHINTRAAPETSCILVFLSLCNNNPLP